MSGYFSNEAIARVLNMAVASTETMNNLDVDSDVIKARLKLIREISDGLGVSVNIPSNRRIMIERLIIQGSS